MSGLQSRMFYARFGEMYFKCCSISIHGSLLEYLVDDEENKGGQINQNSY